MYACLAVTCHLHFWQNDRDFLRATAVTRGWNGYRNKGQHRKSTLEKKILPPFQQGFEPATFQSRVRRSNHWAIPAPGTSSGRVCNFILVVGNSCLLLLLCLCDVFRTRINSLVCWFCTSALGLVLSQIIIIIMYIYHALINALSALMIHISLNMIFYTHVEHSPTKTIYVKYYKINFKNALQIVPVPNSLGPDISDTPRRWPTPLTRTMDIRAMGNSQAQSNSCI